MRDLIIKYKITQKWWLENDSHPNDSPKIKLTLYEWNHAFITSLAENLSMMKHGIDLKSLSFSRPLRLLSSNEPIKNLGFNIQTNTLTRLLILMRLWEFQENLVKEITEGIKNSGKGDENKTLKQVSSLFIKTF